MIWEKRYRPPTFHGFPEATTHGCETEHRQSDPAGRGCRGGPEKSVAVDAGLVQSQFNAMIFGDNPSSPIDARSAEVSYRQGNLRAARGDFAGVIADYDAAIRLDPGHVDAYKNRGNARGSLGDIAGAIADYDAALQRDPRSARVYKNRGNARHFLEDYAGAIADYDTAIALCPNYAPAYRDRGQSRHTQKDYAGAIADYDTAIALEPRYATAYRDRGRTRHAQSDFGGAIADFDEAIRLEPQAYTNYLARAFSYYHLRRKHDAERDYARAFALNPDAFAKEVIDLMAHDFQRDSEHFANCEMHLRRDPSDFPTLSRRGLMHLLCGHEAEARRDFEQYLVLNPAGRTRLERLIAEAEQRLRTLAQS